LPLVSIDALGEPFHAAGDIQRFIACGIEDMICGYDSQGAEGHKGNENC